MVHPTSLVTWESRGPNFIVKARLSIARENNNHQVIRIVRSLPDRVARHSPLRRADASCQFCAGCDADLSLDWTCAE
jgi:hypothetical protein